MKRFGRYVTEANKVNLYETIKAIQFNDAILLQQIPGLLE